MNIEILGFLIQESNVDSSLISEFYTKFLITILWFIFFEFQFSIICSPKNASNAKESFLQLIKPFLNVVRLIIGHFRQENLKIKHVFPIFGSRWLWISPIYCTNPVECACVIDFVIEICCFLFVSFSTVCVCFFLCSPPSNVCLRYWKCLF